MSITERNHEVILGQLVDKTLGRYVEDPFRLLEPRLVLGSIVPEMLDNVPFPSVIVETHVYSHQRVYPVY